jgi:hypothetical protein
MIMKEFLLVIVLPLMIYFMYISLNRIDIYEKKIGIPNRERLFLKYISVLFPIIGFILTQKLRIKE